ncbi:MAG: NrfD/PsrC family molybdoenzyme membrane anchor subunit [Rhodospirillales bacterium]
MSRTIALREIKGRSRGYWLGLGGLALLAGSAVAATFYIEHNGLHVTGMNNQIAWGMPHVISIFLILAGAGAFNVAAFSAVFGRTVHAPLARLSGLLAAALLFGGLSVVMLDLGGPQRLLVAMSNFNFKSTLASNILRYIGFLIAVTAFLWTLMEPRMNRYSRGAGVVAMLLGLSVSTGIGLVFGFLVAREAYDSAVMAPMFVAMSSSFGLAVFILVLAGACSWTGRPLGGFIVGRLRNLLGIFAAVVLYFTTVQHLAGLYATEHHGVERFILMEGGVHTFLFWAGQVMVGGILPLFLVYSPSARKSRRALLAAAAMVIIGGLSQLYVIIIGGQAYPLVLFPGMEVSSSFFDGAVNPYTPTLPETVLSLGGAAIAFLIVAVAMKFLRFLPETLADAALDPHYRPPSED